ncbi:MAG: 1-acyl-sn-glycerol-3-phosphate acyltransferase [Bacteroidota bacterium]
MTSPAEITEHVIDVERVIASKNPRLLKVLPGFLIQYLEKILHQDEINDLIYRHRDVAGLDFVAAMLSEFGVKTETRVVSSAFQDEKKEPVPPASLSDFISPLGKYIIASNHPLGGMDGMALIHEVGKIRKDIVFPVNDILMNVPGLKPLFIPINKHGKNNENVEIIDHSFSSDKVILFFPAGLVSRKHKGGVIHDLEWKKTFITRARKYHRDVIPAYISGKNSSFFYNLSYYRTKLGIKANLEMLYLVDEMIRQKGETLKISFGEPIPWSHFNKSRTDVQWANFVREKVYSLA